MSAQMDALLATWMYVLALALRSIIVAILFSLLLYQALDNGQGSEANPKTQDFPQFDLLHLSSQQKLQAS